MDTSKEISEYKKERYKKVENDSNNIFTIAEDAVAIYSSLNVIIVKRFPRYDKPSSDILGIKSQISNYANNVVGQLWLKQESPSRIYVIDLELGHLTYRAVQQISRIITKPPQSAPWLRQARHAGVAICRKNGWQDHNNCKQTRYQARRDHNLSEKWWQDHTDCASIPYQRSQVARDSQRISQQVRTYEDVVANNCYNYSVPTQN